MREDIGEEFHRNTKYNRGKMPRGTLDLSQRPPVYKHYDKASTVLMPPSKTTGGPGLWTLMNQRRSVRVFSEEPMTKTELAQLLWATQGITRASVPAYGGEIDLRTAPSAGALYPIETYLCINNVDGIKPGFYHYAVPSRKLELIEAGDFRLQLADAALRQTMFAAGNVVFIWTGVFERSVWKYRQRAYRYVFLDAGHIAQNLALAAEGLGLGSCQVAAFFDDEVNQLLHLDGETESVLYLSIVGKRK